jgi:hypothetical protein
MEDKGGGIGMAGKDRGKVERKREKGRKREGAGELAPKHKILTPPMWWTIYRDVLNSYPMVIKA